MRRATYKLGVLLLLTASASLGCSERTVSARLPDDAGKRYAAAFCAAESNCGCEIYESRDACEADIAAAFDDATAEISAFDEACFEALLADPDIQGCAEPDAVGVLCTAIVGAKPVGAACERDPRVYTVLLEAGCEVGTVCDRVVGRCSQTHSEIPEPLLGEPCDPAIWVSCGVMGKLYCNMDGTCWETKPLGGSCSHFSECAGTSGLSYCAGGTGVCTLRHALGEPCDPGDQHPCQDEFIPPTTSKATWCNPASAVCETSPPYVCWIIR